jgi:hypothetical protein
MSPELSTQFAEFVREKEGQRTEALLRSMGEGPAWSTSLFTIAEHRHIERLARSLDDSALGVWIAIFTKLRGAAK